MRIMSNKVGCMVDVQIVGLSSMHSMQNDLYGLLDIIDRVIDPFVKKLVGWFLRVWILYVLHPIRYTVV